MIYLTSPTIARFDSSYLTKIPLLEAHLQYVDKKVDFEIKRLKDNAHWWIKDEQDQEEYQEKLKDLKNLRRKSLLFKDNEGYYTYSGLAYDIAVKFNDSVKVNYTLPEPSPLPWNKIPKYKDRPYQTEAYNALLGAAHLGPSRVEIATGMGKSTVIRNIIRNLGLKTIVIAPSTSIAKQLYEDLSYCLGKRYIGFFGAGKKESDKLIVVSIDDSLVRVEKEDEHWDNLSSAEVLLWDESHTSVSETLSKVCLGLCSSAPYRFFFSATQIRNDGLDLLLDAITGETVYSMTAKEGVDQGYLSKIDFKMVRTYTENTNIYKDPNKQTRKHLYYNKRVLQCAANLANQFVTKMKKPTLILVEEVEQFTQLLPYLKCEVKFAHGPLNKDNKDLVPEQFQESNVNKLVEEFNLGKIPILVGTSAIATGTDLQVVEACIYLMGKASEIKVKQAVGRCTRGGVNSQVINPWTNVQKTECIFVDFDIVNCDILHRHAMTRRSYYNEIYPPIIEIDY